MLFSALSIPLRDYTKFKPGAELEEQPLFFYDANYVYADSLLADGDVMVISAYDKLDKEQSGRIAEFARTAAENGFTPLLLIASTPEEAAAEGMNPALLASTYFADRKELLTLNRSNGGVSFISDGQIIRKWAFRSMPDAEELSSIKEKAPMDVLLARQNRTRALFQGFTLYLFAVLLLL